MVGAVIGVVMLGEARGVRGLLAIVCVTIATGGSARFERTAAPAPTSSRGCLGRWSVSSGS